MAANRRIIGICLVRNEERFLDLILTNIIDFCDQIFIADNKSTDRTRDIAKRWASNNKSVSVTSINHPAESHEMLMSYIDTPTWVFAVDGDELYDPVGLKQMRKEILAGLHDGYWRIIGNVLNCVHLDIEEKRARGYLSPPSRSITKLFNFNAIVGWSGVHGERLHGGEISFKNGYQESSCLRLHEQISWEKSNLRCLHVCFLARSSKDRKTRNGVVTRWNLAEQQSRGFLILLFSKIVNFLGISMSSNWKHLKYSRGDLVTKDIVTFLYDGCEHRIA
jgi:glycosyltransferase involved in cell wall biosynthesis